jgi:hypothetical protein
MTAASLTLADLRELCDRYVPKSSRHPDSLEHPDRFTQDWRYSHELGHLLTVPPSRIGSWGFGMDPLLEGDPREAVWIPYDLAAMHVSRRLLTACGRVDLFYGIGGELSDANFSAVHDNHYATAHRILRRRRVLRLPRNRDGLEEKLRRVVEQAPRTQRSIPATRR